MSAPREIPFCDRDGNHRMTLSVEVGEHGEPPKEVELFGTDRRGRTTRWCYRRERRPGTEAQWAYVETSRVLSRVPPPGSQEALMRVQASSEWRV